MEDNRERKLQSKRSQADLKGPILERRPDVKKKKIGHVDMRAAGSPAALRMAPRVSRRQHRHRGSPLCSGFACLFCDPLRVLEPQIGTR
ncbi:hypothetical protein EYF80_010697 [Liparis tanakae]|uniref:Uncharacterized protein n=1 Tax=Liparis tanakae TaxID=230148 RepID=A0A4Z2IMR9_9TELE|nr:hypothetical protein EYF80_010697 [Liparis tanakae]